MSSSSRGSPSRPKRPSTAPFLSLSTASTAQAEDSFVPPPPLARRTARHASSSDEPFSFATTPPAPSSGSAPSSTLSDAAARGDLAAFLDVVLASHRLTPPSPALVAGPVDYVPSLQGAAARLASSFERREGARRGSGQATMSGAVLLRKLEQLALELAQGTEQGQVLWPTDVECLRDGLHFMLVLSEAQVSARARARQRWHAQQRWQVNVSAEPRLATLVDGRSPLNVYAQGTRSIPAQPSSRASQFTR